MLFFFKYINFASRFVADIFGLFSIQINPITLDLLLPVGISFYTFQTLSYVMISPSKGICRDYCLNYFRI